MAKPYEDNAGIPRDHPLLPQHEAIVRNVEAVVLGRKNPLGSRSERGTEVAALFYSLVESARLNSVDPAHYLRCAPDAASDGPVPLLPRHAMLLT